MEILPFATTWMDLAGIMLNELHQTGKDKIPYDFTNIWKPKAQQNRNGYREQTGGCQSG